MQVILLVEDSLSSVLGLGTVVFSLRFANCGWCGSVSSNKSSACLRKNHRFC